MASVTLLLPARSRLGGEWPTALSRILGRATRLPPGEAGERAQLLRHFDLLPRGWPVAALTRQADVGDADTGAWLRADPAWVRPEMTGARLFACSDGVGVTQSDVDALLPALQPVFGDAGFALDAPNPSRWYLKVPPDAPLPVCVDPSEALGTDVFDHLPGNSEASGTSRRWRTLLNDAQIVLHNHPRNAHRMASGLPPINSLWFWGGGALPARVASVFADIHSDDATLRSLALAAAVASVQPLAAPWVPPALPALVDLRSARSTHEVAAEWILPVTRAMAESKIDSVLLDFEDGTLLALQRHHRWRFWRRPLHSHLAKARAPQSGMEPPE